MFKIAKVSHNLRHKIVELSMNVKIKAIFNECSMPSMYFAYWGVWVM